MASLFVIGNGFDIAHGIKSNYSDFRGYLIKTHQGVKVGDDYVPPVPEPTLLSEYYDENDYIRDYDKFLAFVKEENKDK